MMAAVVVNHWRSQFRVMMDSVESGEATAKQFCNKGKEGPLATSNGQEPFVMPFGVNHSFAFTEASEANCHKSARILPAAARSSRVSFLAMMKKNTPKTIRGNPCVFKNLLLCQDSDPCIEGAVEI
jgi:hypothetical protein